jgi:myo-inositol-1(or 4)-monophosphatase
MTASIRQLLLSVCSLVGEHMPAVQAGRYQITYKSDGSPVTQADKLLERVIRQHLEQHLPALTFIGEESFDFRTIAQTGYLALLDPIDGTENFCSGLKEWGVSLGIWRDGAHQGSLLLMPELGERLLTGDTLEPRFSRITGLSSSFDERIVDALRAATEYRVTGCAVYNLLSVIQGSFARFCNPKGAYAWDLLPGLMLALEHRCDVLVNDEVFDGRTFLDPTRRYRVDIQHRYDLHRRQGT